MSAAKKQRELNRTKEEHDKSRLRAGFAESRKEMVSMVDTVLAQKVEELEKQLATMTADRDRLLSVMCEIAGSKSLTATPTQFYQHLQRIASDATITNPEALADTADLKDVILCHAEPVGWCGTSGVGEFMVSKSKVWNFLTIPLYRAWEPK